MARDVSLSGGQKICSPLKNRKKKEEEFYLHMWYPPTVEEWKGETEEN